MLLWGYVQGMSGVATQVSLEKLEKESTMNNLRLRQLQRELDDLNLHNTNLKSDNITLTASIRQHDDAARSARMEAAKLTRTKESNLAKLRQVEKKLAETDQAHDDLKSVPPPTVSCL